MEKQKMPIPNNSLLAKPAGITFRDHTDHVVAEIFTWLKMHPALVKKYELMFGISLNELLPLVAEDHDLGKKIDPWQAACQKDYQAFKDWFEQNPQGCWEDFGRAQPDFAGKHLKTAGMRHEFYSPLLVQKRELSIPALLSIMAHHGKLAYEYEHRWDDKKQPQNLIADNNAAAMRKLINRIVNEKDRLDEIFEEDSEDAPAMELLKHVVVRGALQIADQRASAKEEAGETPQYQPFHYEWNPKWDCRPVQQKAVENWHQNLLLLKATTGAGKTDAAFLWAQKQIEAGLADHLIIAMPTRFTANAISVKATNQMSQSGLYHSSAWHHLYFSTVEKDFSLRKKADAQHRYSRILLAPATVCTIDHLLISMTLMREDHHQILTQLASSCVVIDEADFYDSFVQANLIQLLKLLRVWKVPVMLMSASLPDSAVALYRKSGFEIEGIVDGNTDKEYNRERFALEDYKQYEDVAALAQQVIDIHEGEAVIVYVNVVEKAIELYKHLKKAVNVPVEVYHSAFTETDKIKKESRILELLGEAAWKNGNKPEAIVILTQIGEMSINISASCMVSDLCPMDRLIQRAGRLQRFSDQACGRMWIMKPMKFNTKTNTSEFYPAPYGTPPFRNKKQINEAQQQGAETEKSKGWVPSKYITETEKYFCNNVGEVFTNGRLDYYNNCVYKELEEFDSASKSNADLLPRYLKKNIFIRGDKEIQEEDEETSEWSSRNIDPQQEIFVDEAWEEFEAGFKKGFTYRQYQNLVMKYAIRVRYYEIDRLLGRTYGVTSAIPKMSSINIRVGKKEKRVFILNQGFYSLETGFDKNGQEDMCL